LKSYNRLILILVFSQLALGLGCTQTSFDSASGGSLNGPQGFPGAGNPTDETHSSGGVDATGNIIQLPTPPQDFTASNCMLGYNYQIANAPTPAQVIFNESDVLTAFSPATHIGLTPGLTVSLWYSDEHAMPLGVRHVTVVDVNGGKTETDYPVSAMIANPDVVSNPRIGAFALTGDQAGTDTSVCTDHSLRCGRPIYPAVFVTDITANASSQSGDWQYGGNPIPPDAVYGSWKGVSRVVNHQTNTVQILVDNDPSPNNSNIGSGITAPAGTGSEGYSTVVSWDVSKLSLQSGHSYRIQFMVHDGDEHYTGGDVGENCVNLSVP
jgi:hypothetical protein